ncbi:hypothetical protein OVA10_11340 [Lelliottia sp. SL45]|uniref:hypothetical protein n=1 Tax=Lelliottia sp. SL45 TaxID=2994665 RepID=UPI00227585B9|nr:hypothetical protein [Lelliottia sp. SL45]MCY1698638.1 hypothetical protein [Lelliottia sp. SL45]
MHTDESMIAIYVPESLIPGIREFSGSVLLYVERMHVEGGFALTTDEFVASLKVLREAGILAGNCCHCDATISNRAEHPS